MKARNLMPVALFVGTMAAGEGCDNTCQDPVDGSPTPVGSDGFCREGFILTSPRGVLALDIGVSPGEAKHIVFDAQRVGEPENGGDVYSEQTFVREMISTRLDNGEGSLGLTRIFGRKAIAIDGQDVTLRETRYCQIGETNEPVFIVDDEKSAIPNTVDYSVGLADGGERSGGRLLRDNAAMPSAKDAQGLTDWFYENGAMFNNFVCGQVERLEVSVMGIRAF